MDAKFVFCIKFYARIEVFRLGTDHYFFIGRLPFSLKKLFASCSWLKKNCLLQGYELKKIVCKAKGNFLEYNDISKF